MGFFKNTGAGSETFGEQKKLLYIEMLEYISMSNPMNDNKPNIWGYDINSMEWKNEEMSILGDCFDDNFIRIQLNRLLLLNLKEDLGGEIILIYRNGKIHNLNPTYDGYANFYNFSFSQEFINWFTEK